jgi:hypothetical protein
LRKYKGLADKADCLREDLKSSEAVLSDERSRVERCDETIRVLKEEIGALKRPQ